MYQRILIIMQLVIITTKRNKTVYGLYTGLIEKNI